MAKADWLTVSPMSGTGNATLINTGTSHTGRSQRTTSVTATVKGLGASRSYRVVQKALAEFVSIEGASSVSVNRTKGLVTLKGRSNSSRLTFSSTSNGVTVPSEYSLTTSSGTVSVSSGSDIPDDPGSGSEYSFEVQVSVTENPLAESRTLSVTCTAANGETVTWSLEQAASVFTYTLTLIQSVLTIAAKGGSSTISGILKTYRNGSMIMRTNVTPTCSVSDSVFSVTSGNVVSVGSRGTTVGDARSTTVTGSYDGTTATVTVSQEANKVESSVDSGGEVTYGNVSVGTITNATIPASGGTKSATAGKGSQSKTVAATYRTDTYTSEDTDLVQTATAVTTTESIDPSVSSISGTASSKGTTISGVTTVKSQSVTWTGNGGKSASGTMYVYQEANSLESTSYTGGDVTWGDVIAGTITNATISASGGTKSATAGNGSQTWTSTAAYRTDTYTSGDSSDPVLDTEGSSGTNAVSPSVSSISGTASSKGTTISGVTTVKSQSVTWTGNGGKSASGTMYVYQAANSRTLELNSGAVSYDDIGADGSAATPSFPTYPCCWSYSSGSTLNIPNSSLSKSYTKNWGGGSSYNNASLNTSTGAVTASSLGTTVKSRVNVLDVKTTFSINGYTAYTVTYVYQEANSVVSYGSVNLSVDSPVSMSVSGDSYTISPTTSQSVTYTSGSSRSGSVSCTYSVSSSLSGFSLSGSTVTVTANTSTSARNGFKVKVTASGEGSKSNTATVTFNQEGVSATLEVSPSTLSFTSSSGSKTISITSNGSWTVS